MSPSRIVPDHALALKVKLLTEFKSRPLPAGEYCWLQRVHDSMSSQIFLLIMNTDDVLQRRPPDSYFVTPTRLFGCKYVKLTC